jgi:hypothetical protein
MTDDIGKILKSWRYLSNDINVRIIMGQDGKEKLQMRLDLGLLQMELDGRPDGRRPHRCETYFKYYMQKASRQKNDDSTNFQLTPVDCWLLQQEASQFYHRYLALMRLRDFDRVIRDTMRNLHVFDFVAKHSQDDEIIWSFEQYRPYVIAMNTRAYASQCMDVNDYDNALEYLQQGMKQLKRFYKKHGKKFGDDRIELELLEEWAHEIKQKKPVSERERLNRALARAVRMEEYERAAHLRDKLTDLDNG